MSLQRILDVARRQNMAVIVTDVAGREPSVVLSLDLYERLLSHAPEETSGHRAPAQPTPDASSHQVTPPLPPPARPPQDTLRMRQRDQDRVETLHRSLDTVSEPSQPTPSLPPLTPALPAPTLDSRFSIPDTTPSPDLLLEERFSFQK